MAGQQNELFEFDFEPIKGYPELRWAGKRPFTGTPYYPAQLKESHGEPADDGWMNRLYWGDNLQVMSHLLKNFRGKINLIYIDPPFDSKADYKKKISLRGGGGTVQSDSNNFEEKQYGDIWTNDEYLQFMYERLILCRELLAETGSIYLHCDWHRSHYLRNILDEVFGAGNFVNEIVWWYPSGSDPSKRFNRKHDTIFWYSKMPDKQIFNFDDVAIPYTEEQIKRFKEVDEYGRKFYWNKNPRGESVKTYIKSGIGEYDVWNIGIDATLIKNINYPTAKPPKLLERIIKASSNPGDIVFDCFMGSGTTQAVALKLGRRFLGADINLGAVQTTTKRLLKLLGEREKGIGSSGSELFAEQSPSSLNPNPYNLSPNTYQGFEVYNVNDYEFFRNELEAKKLIIEALGMQALPENNLWDAELDGRLVSILGINRIATASEFEKIIANIDIASWQRKQAENPEKPVEQITFVCMGHDPNLAAMFEQKMEALGFRVDLEILDILRDKKELRFKRDADAKITVKDGKLKIDQFYPMNLLQKLSLESQDVGDWKELTDSVMIDWHYDGVTFTPETTDIPGKSELVKGEYEVPANAGTIHVKITDLISESWEGTINHREP